MNAETNASNPEYAQLTIKLKKEYGRMITENSLIGTLNH